ncbi:class II aldolase/adducin family protein [Siccirubricoccus sp. KC 17139]|uniref:Class II aldolase/adducin family protein n=1 Tax=Siccirubricoccus soli TaxID=2899147 RepID=A0ABT1DD54_9PROT|nr:class II aldolase/adducin family protein [Siccirubricoccus soli]MCO6419839.1 class II aldolase/adducin family protein [Siccirubricoccus soli]MCP2685974.1 class II aldolase/adducin family protein [Siccirubricoccus soli]
MPEPDLAAAEELVAAAQALDALGFMPSKSGNLSLRTVRGCLITPAALPYAALTPAALVEIDLEGTVLRGSRRPSSEWRLHTAIYAARPEAGAVVHTHSPFATALSCARQGLPAFHYMIALGGGADIRCSAYATFGTAALAEACLDSLRDRRATLLANHGVVALGRTLAGARTLAMEVENLARQYLALRAAGLSPVLLTEAELREVFAQFGDYGRLT